MKLSRKFLNDYLDLDNISSSDIANKMVLVGNEYESITHLSNASGLVVGHILECNKHPESTKLSICKVDLGDGVKQILCGAPNVAAGQKVIVAKVGAKLGDLEIKEAKLAGMTSEGMICSLLELGIETKYLTEEDKNGIHVLSSHLKVGSDPIKHLNLDDEVIDFELTSNRGDLLSILGMAYEVGAIYDKKVILPNTSFKELEENINDQYTLSVGDNISPLYLAKLVKNVTIKESPEYIKSRLIASGIRPINNVVDISNYVMLEYGQPLHFFDADKLNSNIGVRLANDNEEFTTLDGIKRVLVSSDIVITSNNVPVALAGVMGGLNTEVDNNTKDILIEAAIFNPINVRNTSKRVVRSEASNRFEKGIDPNRTKEALNRACHLLEELADGEVISGTLTHDIVAKTPKDITVSLEDINNVLGMDLVSEEVLKIFDKLGFKASYNKDFNVTVPTRRLDINIKEDLIEEVGRIHGYDNLIGKLPKVNIKKGAYSKKKILINEINNIMTSLSLNQVLTYSLTKESEYNKFSLLSKPKVEVLSPISEDKKIMRQSIIPGLYNVYEYNKARSIKNVFIYEVGNIYYKEDTYMEDTHLAGLIYGDYITNNWQKEKVVADFYLLKGMIETLLNYLGLNNRYVIKNESIPESYHPYRSASIYVDNNLIGHLGQIHPSIDKKEVYVFELDIEKLLEVKVRTIKFKEINKYPTISRDLAFTMPNDLAAKDVMDVLKRVGGRYLSNIDIFDVYPIEKENAKSIAYSLIFEDATKTLSDDEINQIINKMIEQVEKIYPAKLRSK